VLGVHAKMRAATSSARRIGATAEFYASADSRSASRREAFYLIAAGTPSVTPKCCTELSGPPPSRSRASSTFAKGERIWRWDVVAPWLSRDPDFVMAVNDVLDLNRGMPRLQTRAREALGEMLHSRVAYARA
jgi:hypothetical protein